MPWQHAYSSVFAPLVGYTLCITTPALWFARTSSSLNVMLLATMGITPYVPRVPLQGPSNCSITWTIAILATLEGAQSRRAEKNTKGRLKNVENPRALGRYLANCSHTGPITDYGSTMVHWMRNRQPRYKGGYQGEFERPSPSYIVDVSVLCILHCIY